MEVLHRVFATVTFRRFYIPLNGGCGKVVFHLLDHPVHRPLIQRALVSFQSQQVVSTFVNNLCGNVLLAARRIDGHDRVVQLDLINQLGNRRDFVGFLLGRQLSQTDSSLHGPGAHKKQRSETFFPVMRTPQSFTSHPG